MLRTILNLLTDRPTLCVYEVTTKCNSRCSMCQIWKRKEYEMNLKEIKRVFNDLKRFGIHTIFIQGGEPLVRKDILEIIHLLENMGFRLNIITNGLLLSSSILQKLDQLNKHGRVRVTVSLDTLNRDTYFKIRGVDCLDRVFNNLEKLARYKSLKGTVHTTITNLNYGELMSIYRLTARLGLGLTFNTYNNSVNYASDSKEFLDFKKQKNKIKLVVNEMKNVGDKLPFPVRIFVNENIRYLNGIYLGPCDAFRNSLRITSEGKLSPCLELLPVIDLKEYSINSSWVRVKRKTKKMIEKCYLASPCFYGCTRCISSVKRNILWNCFLKG